MKGLRALPIAALGLVFCSAVFPQFQNVGKLDTWTTRPFARQHSTTSFVRAVRVAKQKGFDHVVFEFDGPVPNYEIKYLKSGYYEGEAGRRRIRIAGSRFIQVTLNQIPIDENQVKVIEAKNFMPQGRLKLPAVAQLDQGEFFEGFFDFLIGVNGRKQFRVSELTNPSRLVIDFRY
jgi:hypothetical protein